jgi:hypothetical protein
MMSASPSSPTPSNNTDRPDHDASRDQTETKSGRRGAAFDRDERQDATDRGDH